MCKLITCIKKKKKKKKQKIIENVLVIRVIP